MQTVLKTHKSMKKAFTISWLAAFVYALCTDALVNARTLQVCWYASADGLSRFVHKMCL